MDIQLLQDIGLTKVQAEAYQALVLSKENTAPAIAGIIGESRSNSYKVLDKLCELGLATKDQHGKKVRYFPTSPSTLEKLIQRQKDEATLRGRKLDAAMPNLLDFFFAHSIQPGVRFFQGKEGARQMFLDQADTSDPIHFVHTTAGITSLGSETMFRLRNLFPARGIERYAISRDLPQPDETPENRMPVEESDKLMLLHRTWIKEEDYPDSVEWVAYGSKLAIMSFDEEFMGILIESPQIANAFRSLFKLMDSTVRLRPDYNQMPKKLRYTRIPASALVNKNLIK